MTANNRVHQDSKKRRSSFLVALLSAAGEKKWVGVCDGRKWVGAGD
jgi:hypothetical protein